MMQKDVLVLNASGDGILVKSSGRIRHTSGLVGWRRKICPALVDSKGSSSFAAQWKTLKANSLICTFLASG